ncbi:MAG: GGDEF domain-containing protein [Spirochaetia bacterium]|nr:GGDEF domain-containing protein [Spirochaetota bacterium]MDW8112909.1 GGDEF domain-containing protein [Spirochaetia bacterium]
MKVFVSNPNYYTSPLVSETDDKTIMELYKIVFGSKDQIREIHSLRKRTKDHKFFQKLIFLLTGINFEEDIAENIWEEIERYYKDMVSLLGRSIHISAVVVDYMFRVKNYMKNPSVVDLVLTEKIKNSAIQDFVTGLYKGSLFENFIHVELNRSKRHGHDFSILLMQVDGLENVYISGNVSVATKLLVEISIIIRQVKRAEDIPFKLSTGKFGIILPQTDKKGAVLFAKRLLNEINTSILSTSGLIFGLSVSIGIQSFPQDGDTAETILSNSAKALYKSKVSGHNKIVYEI